MKALAIVVGVAAFGLAAPALADEVIIHRDTPVVVDAPPPPPPDTVVVEPRTRDCASSTTRREDGLGNSETVTRRSCD